MVVGIEFIPDVVGIEFDSGVDGNETGSDMVVIAFGSVISSNET